ncbi:hypothetical protein GCM10009775_35470 [Microbacterium aoyamense]|uniref:HTH arsR-type domain-containing protein n=2 Tax=Microbacterium aoyamense TaxID=344166 RepID=A0ABP5BF40_9MICO
MHPFQAMADPVRRRLVELLASGEHTAGQLAEVIGHEYRLSRTAVSKHLGLLRSAGFVAVRADLSWRFYRLREDGLLGLECEIALLRDRWNQRTGWDVGLGDGPDPPSQPRRRGPGRLLRSGRRGRQTVIPRANDPEHDMYGPL